MATLPFGWLVSSSLSVLKARYFRPVLDGIVVLLVVRGPAFTYDVDLKDLTPLDISEILGTAVTGVGQSKLRMISGSRDALLTRPIVGSDTLDLTPLDRTHLDVKSGAGQNFKILGRKPRFWPDKKWARRPECQLSPYKDKDIYFHSSPLQEVLTGFEQAQCGDGTFEKEGKERHGDGGSGGGGGFWGG
ncbi:hypothetical protein GGX14DRAFT_394707 [Mycena pura]|uniref:Uncharacterized protein n=1 Tax=Mycena pura TaxID=153505 RepID=A0AAD6VEB8_9AGAR|nr:hypothetical protein GGX14DRAFT_394707 [Mycena pura]